MTPRELLSRTPESIEHGFLPLIVGEGFGYHYYNFLPELGSDPYGGLPFVSTDSDRIEIRVYRDFNFDGRRFWRLASVHFDGRAVMVTQNAGKDGDGHVAKIVIDRAAYDDMIKFMLTLPRKPLEVDDKDQPPTTNVGMDEDFANLDNFYGFQLGENDSAFMFARGHGFF